MSNYVCYSVSFYFCSQVEYESIIEQPYYVLDKGWCSYSPARTHSKYGLICKQLNVGDTCISLCQKNASSDSPTASKPVNNQAKISKRKELENHFNLLTSKDKELNERKKRRWSAPDQINEKTNKKNSAKQSKLNEEDGDTTSTNGHVTTLPTSSNQFQNGEELNVSTTSSYQQPHVSFPNNPNTSYYNQYPTSTISNANIANSRLAFSSIQSSIPSHLQYVSPSSNPSSSSTTHLTPAMTKPIVSHLPLSVAVSSSPSNFSISTLSTPASSHGDIYLTGKPSYLIHSSPSLPGMPTAPSPPTSISFQPSSYASISSTPSFINETSISSIYSRNGYPMKYSTSQPMGGKNNFSNVGTLAKSASGQNGYHPTSNNANMAVDFSKYSTKK